MGNKIVNYIQFTLMQIGEGKDPPPFTDILMGSQQVVTNQERDLGVMADS